MSNFITKIRKNNTYKGKDCKEKREKEEGYVGYMENRYLKLEFF